MDRSITPIISEKEQEELLYWITTLDEQSMIYNQNCDGFFFSCELLQDTASVEINNLIRTVKERIITAENLNKQQIESPIELEDFIYIMPPGTQLHKHKDVNKSGMYHVRFNVLLQKAERGGICVYAGTQIKCQERCYVLCRSGIDFHESTKVEGEKPRIVISYGFNIPINTINAYPNIFKGKISRNIVFMDDIPTHGQYRL